MQPDWHIQTYSQDTIRRVFDTTLHTEPKASSSYVGGTGRGGRALPPDYSPIPLRRSSPPSSGGLRLPLTGGGRQAAVYTGAGLPGAQPAWQVSAQHNDDRSDDWLRQPARTGGLQPPYRAAGSDIQRHSQSFHPEGFEGVSGRLSGPSPPAASRGNALHGQPASPTATFSSWAFAAELGAMHTSSPQQQRHAVEAASRTTQETLRSAVATGREAAADVSGGGSFMTEYYSASDTSYNIGEIA